MKYTIRHYEGMGLEQYAVFDDEGEYVREAGKIEIEFWKEIKKLQKSKKTKKRPGVIATMGDK